MKHTTKSKLFEQTLRLYGREYSLSVFLMFNADKTNYFRCVLDEIKVLDLWINDNGKWIDMQNGYSELGRKLGETIEAKVLPVQHQGAYMNA